VTWNDSPDTPNNASDVSLDLDSHQKWQGLVGWEGKVGGEGFWKQQEEEIDGEIDMLGSFAPSIGAQLLSEVCLISHAKARHASGETHRKCVCLCVCWLIQTLDCSRYRRFDTTQSCVVYVCGTTH